MKNPYPKVLVSILNWNSAQNTLMCMKSLQKCTYENKDILVIDNNSNESIDLLKKGMTSTFTLIENKNNNGYASGHKRSVEYGLNNNYDLLWILNNDLVVEDNTLSALVNYYIKFGPSLILGSVNNENPDLSKFSWKGKDSIIPWVGGFSILIPFPIIKKYGFMNESFFLYGEEVDFCIRMYKHGILSRFVNSSKVNHIGKGSAENNSTISDILNYYKLRNYLYLERMYGLGYKKRMKYLILAHFRNFFKLEKYPFTINKYSFLAIIHVLLSIKGKTINPEKYIK